jgi:leucyl aminopeptidase
LTLAEEKKPDWIIDAATLTGATVVALGEDIAGVYGNSQDLITELIRIGKEEDEIFWQLPLHQPYAEKLKTTIADVKNRGDRWGGGITAALFLKEFISDDTKWIHIDIAGPGGKETSLDHLGKGAKGFGVKSIVSLVHKLVAQ